MYDPFDPELVAGRERARDLCQDLNATREAHQEERRRILSELFGRAVTRCGCSHRSSATTARISSSANASFSTSTASSSTSARFGLAVIRFLGRQSRFTPRCTRSARWSAGTRIREARRHRLGRVDWGRRHHPSGSAHRIRRGDRGGQRRHAGRSRSHVRGRQSVPGDSRNHRSLRPPTTFLRSSYRSDRTPPACSS